VKIAVVASECVPFSKTGGLADVIGALPPALAARGHEVSVITPRYRGISAGSVAAANLTVPLDRMLHFPSVLEGGVVNGVHHFLVDYPPFFARNGLYGDAGEGYWDNPERFGLFSRAALEFLRRQGRADVLHCHDWQAALVPILLKTQYAADPLVGRTPVVFTLHNLGYQGRYGPDLLDRLLLPRQLYDTAHLEYWGDVNLLKGALIFSDALTTVSPRYAEEIQTLEFGHGLDGVLRGRATDLFGILNGVDYHAWDPATDPHLAANYTPEKLEGKRACKKDLLKRFGLPADELKRPVVGVVSRFAPQKGFDLIEAAAEELMRSDLLLVALGAGEPHYEELFRRLAERFPKRVAVRVAYDNALAHQIEAGADMLLMPSRYEPCGLNQIYSLKYGTVPVVRATGGLDDTVEMFDPRTGAGTGFKFSSYTAEALVDAVRQALHVYKNSPPAWRTLMRNGMAKDFSWEASAAAYEKLFARMVKSAAKG
jgi:starch synthase